MADELSMALLELRCKSESESAGVFLQEAVRKMAKALIEGGAGSGDRSEALRADRDAGEPASRLRRVGVGHDGGHIESGRAETYGRGRSSPPCLSVGGGWTRLWRTWWWRPTSGAYRPAK